MNILLITPVIPYPLSEGSKVSQFAILDYLRKIHNVTLMLVENTIDDNKNIIALQHLWPEVEFEIVQNKNNNNLNIYLKSKIRNFINSLEKIKNKNNLNQATHSELENPLFINSPIFKSRSFINSLDKIVLKKEYDIIQVDMLEMIDVVHILPKNTKKIFVHHEIRFVRVGSSLLNKKLDGYENYTLERIKLLEINYLNQYDAVFVFSDVDKEKLEDEPNIKTQIYTAPFPFLDNNFVPVAIDNQEITKLIFIGGEGHPPNRDGVEWYINDIAPLVSEFSDVKLHIVGNWSQETIKYYSNNSNIIFSGYIDDIITYCKNTIMIVPVRIGSGIRTKILYAMAQGIPIISASVGCEGIMVEDQKSIVIANTPKEFANAINILLEKPKFRYKLAIEAQKIAGEHYSQNATTNLRCRLFEKIIA